jgi:hypothetical protein
MRFYRNKLKNLHRLPAHKQEYMVRLAELLVSDSIASMKVYAERQPVTEAVA